MTKTRSVQPSKITIGERPRKHMGDMASYPRDSHIFERETHDHYVEPEWCSVRLFQEENFNKRKPILDACAGIGRVSDAAVAAGYRVESRDIVNRGYAGLSGVQDFLKREAPVAQLVCNPPFTLVPEFVDQAFALGAAKVAVIFPVARLKPLTGFVTHRCDASG